MSLHRNKSSIKGVLLALALMAFMVLSGACAPQEVAAPEPLSGRELYLRHGCALCHGPQGRGDGPVSATLSPPVRDLRDTTTYRVGATEEVIATTIEQGIMVFRGSGMTPFAHIPAEERLGIARYIVSLQEPVPTAQPHHEP